MRRLALLLIRFYQRCISPYKGFCCAYGAYTGHASCSVLGYRAVSRYGLWQGAGILEKRMAKCGVAYRRYRVAALQLQAGFCDLPCDASCASPCDGDASGGGKSWSDCFDVADCCDFSGDKKKRRNEQDLYVPPPRRRPGQPGGRS